MVVQEDLFGLPPNDILKNRIKELDRMIAKAIKGSDYQKAKELNTIQEKLIQELVAIGDGEEKKPDE